MSITAGTTARGLPYPGHASAADVPTHLKALADAIEMMNNSALVLGSTLVVNTSVGVDSAGSATYDMRATSGAADQKRSRVFNASGATSLQSINDAYSAVVKTGFTMNHATGVVDFPNGMGQKGIGVSPYFRAYRSAAQSRTTGQTVIFDSEVDPNGWYNNATGIFLPTVAGTYRVSWGVRTASLTTGNYLYTFLTGAPGDYTGATATQAASSAAIQSGGSALIPFNGTTDSVAVTMFHNQGGSLALSTGGTTRDTHFEAEYVGA